MNKALILIGLLLYSCQSTSIDMRRNLDLPPFDVIWQRDLSRETRYWGLGHFEFMAPVWGPQRQLIVGTRKADLWSVDPRTGAYLWHRQFGEGFEASPLVIGHRLYIGSIDGVLYALNALTGQELWHFKTDSAIQNRPAMDQEHRILVVANALGQIYALNPDNGTPLWRTVKDLPHKDFSLYGHGGPLIADQKVYLTFDDGHLDVYDLDHGHLLWERNLASGSKRFQDGDHISVLVKYKNPLLITSSFKGGLWAWDAQNGQKKWHRDIEGATEISVDQGHLYFGALDGIYCLNAQNGHTVWKIPLEETDMPTQPEVGKNWILVGLQKRGLLLIHKNTGWVQSLVHFGGGWSAKPLMDTHEKLFYGINNRAQLFGMHLSI